MARHLVRRIDRELDLTDAQEAEVARILETHTGRMKGRMGAMHRELHGEMEAAHREIAVVLTPEQREELERLRRRWEHRSR
ncbi:MAG TPA: hypothetical protein VFV54_06410 [Thermoanaerobaculia bacterium]|nr:hypothetical protein [Thermoanaerobaculia bacterium]